MLLEMNIHHSLHAKGNWVISNSFNINVIYLQIVLWYFLQSSFLFSGRSIFSSDALRCSSTSVSADPLLPFARSKSSGNSTDGKENKNHGLYSNAGSFSVCNYIFVSRMGFCGIHTRAVRRTPNNFLIRAIFSSHRMQTAVLTPSGYFCVTLRHASRAAGIHHFMIHGFLVYTKRRRVILISEISGSNLVPITGCPY